MRTSLCSELSILYEAHQDKFSEVLARHGEAQELLDLETFQDDVQEAFFLGVEAACVDKLLGYFKEKNIPQPVSAAAIGLRNRTSISKISKHKRIATRRLLAARYAYPDFELPPPDLAALYGFSYAASHIKSVAYQNPHLEKLSPQDLNYVFGTLADEYWGKREHLGLDDMRGLAIKIYQERTLEQESLLVPNKLRAQQVLLMLQTLVDEWADSALLSLLMIPQCIPLEEAGEEA